MSLTANFLRALVSFDPKTGDFRWLRKTHFKNQPGDLAGHVTSQGYVAIGIGGRKYLAHRLAWLHHYGQMPSGYIDHINGDKRDNRIANLRDGSMSANLQNLKAAHLDSAAGLLGVSRKRRKWQARISVNGQRTTLGLFNTPEEAHAAYLDAKRRLHPACTI